MLAWLERTFTGWRSSSLRCEFTTRSAGTLKAPRRVVLVYLAMHGMAPGWPMDYLFLNVESACDADTSARVQ